MKKNSNGVERREGIRSLGTTINIHEERNHGRKLEKNKANISHPQNSHIEEKFTMEKLKQSSRSAVQEKALAEFELSHAKKAVKELVLKIEKSNAQVHARKLELQSLRKSTYGGEDAQHAELMQQLERLKQELSKLKIDVSSALESKVKAEKDIEVYNQKTSSSLKKMEELRKEIEKANEEHVLVELARIEAEKEHREIKTQRAAEAMEFSKNMEVTKKRITELRREITRAKELEETLAATNNDVSVLQNEMELVRAMEKNFQKEILESNDKKSSDQEQLQIVENELSKAKKELESIKEEGFQFMASMDLVRVELLQVSEETNRMKKLEKNAESTVEHLNSKLLKARSMLESTASAEERTRGIVSNLSTALQQLQAEVESAKEEKEKTNKETSDIKQEIERTEIDIKSTREELQGNISVLESVKALEAAALVKLKSMAESMVKSRAMASQNSSMICLSNWEYEYLSKKAGLAQEVADKKVAAIHAWIEALKAQEKEILLKSELIEKEIRAKRAANEDEVCNIEKAVSAQKTMEEEANESMDMLKVGISSHRKLSSENSMTAIRRCSKARRVSAMEGMKSASPSPSFAIKKRKRVMPNMATILRSRRGGKKQNKVDFDSYASLLLAHEKDHSQL